jgi:hypothetical protein
MASSAQQVGAQAGIGAVAQRRRRRQQQELVDARPYGDANDEQRASDRHCSALEAQVAAAHPPPDDHARNEQPAGP